MISLPSSFHLCERFTQQGFFTTTSTILPLVNCSFISANLPLSISLICDILPSSPLASRPRQIPPAREKTRLKVKEKLNKCNKEGC
ncbi:hypothetical protein M5K25_023055 [Dendrobium thyrsiflorum]|uniref:Uncharacterized protein n=1 Tax=Dendrobium thyrsiflorum TaxID=117978 RepID=A0ABD0U762_DENTH